MDDRVALITEANSLVEAGSTASLLDEGLLGIQEHS